MKLSFFDTESAWDEQLHEAYRSIDPRQIQHRIGSKRIAAASVLDLDLAEDGQITCQRICSWTEHDHGDEEAIIAALFEHLRLRPDRGVVGYGTVANDLPVLTLAAMEHGLPMPQQFLPPRPGPRRGEGLPSHFDLGLALKGRGKTWHHLTEIIVRMGLPATLMQTKSKAATPRSAEEWKGLRAHVELDAALLAIATLAWLRSHGQSGVNPRIVSLAILDWLRREGHMTEALQANLATVCQDLTQELIMRFDQAA